MKWCRLFSRLFLRLISSPSHIITTAMKAAAAAAAVTIIMNDEIPSISIYCSRTSFHWLWYSKRTFHETKFRSLFQLFAYEICCHSTNNKDERVRALQWMNYPGRQQDRCDRFRQSHACFLHRFHLISHAFLDLMNNIYFHFHFHLCFSSIDSLFWSNPYTSSSHSQDGMLMTK